MYISKNFTLYELTSSKTAISKCIANKPNELAVANLCKLVHFVLQPLRDFINVPVLVSSGYRSPSLNKYVGGVPNSQHLYGCACDIFTHTYSVEQLLSIKKFLSSNQYVDELIFHDNYIHFSIKSQLCLL